MDVSELRNLVYKANPDNLNEFARELGYTVEELSSMKGILGDYTLGDLFDVPESTMEKYEELTAMISSITSGGLKTASTVQTIIDKYPSLM
jgi:hypothetical protein